MTLKEQCLAAARADSIPAGSAGLWVIRKQRLVKRTLVYHCGKHKWVDPCSYTWLGCYTNATLHEGGEAVMHDTPEELGTHLEFMLRARGSVLITGLGLGCVTRGVLANPAVKKVLVIERDKSVLKLVAPYMAKDPRLFILHFDAIAWCKKTTEEFDCAWHDLWDNEDWGGPSLGEMHAELLIAMTRRVRFQGAWNMPRHVRRLCAPCGVI